MESKATFLSLAIVLTGSVLRLLVSDIFLFIGLFSAITIALVLYASKK